MTDKTIVGYIPTEAPTDSYDYDHIMCQGLHVFICVYVYTPTYVCMTYIYACL